MSHQLKITQIFIDVNLIYKKKKHNKLFKINLSAAIYSAWRRLIFVSFKLKWDWGSLIV